MKRFLLSTSSLGILVVSAGALATLIAQAPAFNTELRRDNVFGQTILQSNRDMYDRGRYLMQQATSFVRADAVVFDEADAGAASVEVTQERGLEAVALLEESAALSPGNAEIWATMAWAQLYAGDFDASLRALRLSWELAPYNLALTRERIDLAVILFDSVLLEDAVPVMTEMDQAALTRDVTLLRDRFGQEEFARFANDLDMAGITLDLPEAGA